MQNGDSNSYKIKAELEKIISTNLEMRNAALNDFYYKIKDFYNTEISFDEFLYSEIPLYRGASKDQKYE